MNRAESWLAADWPAPAGIRAGVTLRHGGVSTAQYASFNLGDHVGDDEQAVATNRSRLRNALRLPGEPVWLWQVHGTTVAMADEYVGSGTVPEADASVATQLQTVCAVLTADCLPVLFCDRAASCWGAAHAGWRGLVAGVLEATAARLPAPPDTLLAWLGPGIGPRQFEVGQDVVDAFVERHPADRAAFTPRTAPGKYLADIRALARARLQRAGVTAVYGGSFCTVSDAERFYSYRRDGTTGRIASLVWRAATG